MIPSQPALKLMLVVPQMLMERPIPQGKSRLPLRVSWVLVSV